MVIYVGFTLLFKDRTEQDNVMEFLFFVPLGLSAVIFAITSLTKKRIFRFIGCPNSTKSLSVIVQLFIKLVSLQLFAAMIYTVNGIN